MAPARTGTLLLAGALTAAVLAGCGSAGSSASTSSSTSGAPGTTSPGPAASAQPSWAAVLGPGVTVVAPQTVAPGHDSPGAVVEGLLTALNSKQPAEYCGYAMPAQQAQCRSIMSRMPARDFPYWKNAAIGYVAIKGNQAAVGMTGTFCTSGQSPKCFTNTDPAAVFPDVSSFSGLWENAITDTADQYSLTPCEKVGGKWYVYSPG
jgi:hypothetical protein